MKEIDARLPERQKAPDTSIKSVADFVTATNHRTGILEGIGAHNYLLGELQSDRVFRRSPGTGVQGAVNVERVLERVDDSIDRTKGQITLFSEELAATDVSLQGAAHFYPEATENVGILTEKLTNRRDAGPQEGRRYEILADSAQEATSTLRRLESIVEFPHDEIDHGSEIETPRPFEILRDTLEGYPRIIVNAIGEGADVRDVFDTLYPGEDFASKEGSFRPLISRVRTEGEARGFKVEGSIFRDGGGRLSIVPLSEEEKQQRRILDTVTVGEGIALTHTQKEVIHALETASHDDASLGKLMKELGNTSKLNDRESGRYHRNKVRTYLDKVGADKRIRKTPDGKNVLVSAAVADPEPIPITPAERTLVSEELDGRKRQILEAIGDGIDVRTLVTTIYPDTPLATAVSTIESQVSRTKQSLNKHGLTIHGRITREGEGYLQVVQIPPYE